MTDAADPSPDPQPPAAAPDPCWRCGKAAPPTAAGECRWCRARLCATARPASSLAPASHLTRLLVLYALLLGTSVVWGWVILAEKAPLSDEADRTGTAVMEVVDTLVVVVGLGLVGRQPLPRRLPARYVPLAWLFGAAATLGLVILGTQYTALIREFTRAAPAPHWTNSLSPATLLLVCLQPAVVEELFFRGIALGVLARSTTLPTAVGASAVMFAMAHLYNPLGLPYLFVCGLLLGVARAYGGLALPMVLHFAHNLLVTLIEGNG